MSISFSKMVAAGNDFIIVDNRKRTQLKTPGKIAKLLSNRKFSIGADGLLTLDQSKHCDVRMRLFNSDGSEAEMCGNGVRCLAQYAVQQKIAKKKLSIETLAGVIHAEINGDNVKAKMVDPKDLKSALKITTGHEIHELHFINTGVPHVVKFVEDLEHCDVKNLGRQIRQHAAFAPKGTNVNFVFLSSEHSLNVRTYERGVEDETLACGTGSTASALVAAAVKNAKSPVSVRTRSGEILKIHFLQKGVQFSNVVLEGKVKKSFEGRVSL